MAIVKTDVKDICKPTDIDSLWDFGAFVSAEYHVECLRVFKPKLAAMATKNMLATKEATAEQLARTYFGAEFVDKQSPPAHLRYSGDRGDIGTVGQCAFLISYYANLFFK